MKKIKILYEEKAVDMDMLDTVLKCFNQDITVREVRELINKEKENGKRNEKAVEEKESKTKN